MPDTRKRPCSICRRWFRPDARVGARQYVCSQPECQKARRRKKQAAWRARNPDYFITRRMDRRDTEDRPEPLRLPAPLSELPWDIAQSQFGVQGADFIGVMGKTLLHAAQSQFEAYRVDSSRVPARLPPPVPQSQNPVGAE